MNQHLIARSILATIIYYDILGNHPLTSFEIYKHLTNPSAGKLSVSKKLSDVKFSQIIDILTENQKLKSLISQKNGFYFLKNRAEIVSQRIERYKIADKKWKKIRRIVRWFQIIPYIQMVSVSGSLALNNTRKESDLDLLISAKYGRIWTVRVLLSGFTQIIGQRRHGQSIENKICLNQYITDQYLKTPLENLSNAHSCLRLVPLLGANQHQKFLGNNCWIKKYLPLYHSKENINLRAIRQNGLLCFISHIFEFLLNTPSGDFLEKKVSQWQKNRIIKKTKSSSIALSPNEIKQQNNLFHLCLSNETLIFHYPISRNAQVQNKYLAVIDQTLKQF